MSKRRTLSSRVIVFLVLLSHGCSFHYAKHYTPRFKYSGEMEDLLLERTLEPSDAEGPFQSSYYNVDGHGAYDVPVVFVEHIVLLPVTALDKPVWFLSYGGGHYDRDNPVLAALLEAQPAAVALLLAGPLIVYADVSVSITDAVIHDIPVILVGLPTGHFAKMKRGGYWDDYVIEGPYGVDTEN